VRTASDIGGNIEVPFESVYLEVLFATIGL